MNRYVCTTEKPALYYIPGLLVAVALATTVTGYYAASDAGDSPTRYLAFLAPVLIAVMLVVFRLYRPVAVVLTDDELVVDRTASTVSIPYAEIIKVSLPDNKDLRLAIRTFGNGGLFGYTGKYYKQPYGPMTWYCSQRKNFVLIETSAGKKIVVTPDERDAMVKALRERVSAAG